MTDKQQSYFRQQAPVHYDVMNAQVQRIREMAKQAARRHADPWEQDFAEITASNQTLDRLRQYLAARWGVTQFAKIPDSHRHIALNDLFLMEDYFAGISDCGEGKTVL